MSELRALPARQLTVPEDDPLDLHKDPPKPRSPRRPPRRASPVAKTEPVRPSTLARGPYAGERLMKVGFQLLPAAWTGLERQRAQLRERGERLSAAAAMRALLHDRAPREREDALRLGEAWSRRRTDPADGDARARPEQHVLQLYPGLVERLDGAVGLCAPYGLFANRSELVNAILLERAARDPSELLALDASLRRAQRGLATARG